MTFFSILLPFSSLIFLFSLFYLIYIAISFIEKQAIIFEEVIGLLGVIVFVIIFSVFAFFGFYDLKKTEGGLMDYIPSQEYQDLEDRILQELTPLNVADKFCYNCPKYNKDYNTCIAEYCYTWW